MSYDYVRTEQGIKLPEEVTFLSEKFGIPERFRHAHLHESVTGDVPDQLRQYVVDFPVESVILAGSTGIGKTHYACALVNELIRIHNATGFTGHYFNTAVHLPKVLDNRAFKRYDIYASQMAKLENSDVLILDDLLHVPGAEWAREVLYRIYEARYASGLRTITTLNANVITGDDELDWSSISDIFNDAFMRRVVESAANNLMVFT